MTFILCLGQYTPTQPVKQYSKAIKINLRLFTAKMSIHVIFELRTTKTARPKYYLKSIKHLNLKVTQLRVILYYNMVIILTLSSKPNYTFFCIYESVFIILFVHG